MNTTHSTQHPRWGRTTRFLHMGLALIVSLQLLNSLVMEAPEPDHPLSGLEALLFHSHAWLGMTALAVVLLHWAWSLWGAGGIGMRHLFPWRAAERTAIAQELRGLLTLRLPPGGPTGKLSGLIHGLGILAVTGAALTGAVLFFALPENGQTNLVTGAAKEAHELISTFVWTYWIGHVMMGLLHHFVTRDTTLRDMLNLRADQRG
ncbi:MAG: cytochrome b/b6 domain-containing protein [Gammaproteobacteria bacterium]|nr:cytochrome b/b6 domain-containing protein [Gammaproteobacteria bacterium]